MILGEFMRISLIAALTPLRVIGKNNQLPWHMPADLQYFKKVTLGKPVIMGRKTYESIGRPLPGRKNIIITRQKNFSVPAQCEIFSSVEEALEVLKKNNKNYQEVFVIGGSEIFAHTLPLADYLYLTFIDADITGDTYFPDWDNTLWQEIFRENHLKDAENIYNYSFVVFEKKIC
jgi:dihydrofolate reductase